MQNPKLVTVIIPFYNAKIYLKKSIESVLAQTYTNLEIILVDDCSNDGSIKIAKNYQKKDSRIKIYKTKKNSGEVAVPRNLGISKSTGEFISFLDADDFWYKNKIELQIKCIKNKLICSSSCDYVNFDLKKTNFLNYFFRLLIQIFFFWQLCKGKYFLLYIYNPVIVSSVLMKRIINKKIIQFTTKENTREDLNLWLYIFKNYYKKFIFINKSTLSIRRSKNSLSSNQLKEFGKIINTLITHILYQNNFKYIFYVVIGIFLRSLKIVFQSIFIRFRKHFTSIMVLFFVGFFSIYYTPLFWFLGKPLLVYDKVIPQDVNNILLFSGHGDTSYYNQTYLKRYQDAKDLFSNKKISKKFFFLED